MTVGDLVIAVVALVHTVVYEGGVGGCHFQCGYTVGHTTDTESRQVDVVGAAILYEGGEAELQCVLVSVVQSDLRQDLDCAGVDGLLESSSQGLLTGVCEVGVLRPFFAVDVHLFVDDDGCSGDVVAPHLIALGVVAGVLVLVFFALGLKFKRLLQGCGVGGDGLDRRSGLSGGDGSVEEHLTFLTSASGHGHNGAGLVVDDGHGCLRLNVGGLQGEVLGVEQAAVVFL